MVSSEGHPLLQRFDIENNRYVWQYSDFAANRFTSLYSYREDLEIIAGWHWDHSLSFNLKTGQPIWTDNIRQITYGHTMMSTSGEYFYHSHKDRRYDSNIDCLVRKHLVHGNGWDTLLVLRKKDFDNHNIGLIGPSIWLDDQKDSILILPFRLTDPNNALNSRSDLLAFNLRTREIIWHLPIFTHIVSVQAPLVYQYKAYLSASRMIYCFDLKAGRLLWERKIYPPEMGSVRFNENLYIFDDKLIAKNQSGDLIVALDPETGSTIWQTAPVKISGGRHELIRYKDYILSAQERYFDIIRLSDGKIVYQMHNKPPMFKGRMALDEANRLLYVSDNRDIVCYQLAEEY